MSHKASVAIIIYEHKILLLLRDDKPNIPDPNVWQLPGGQIAGNENHLQTIQRELEEEICMVPNNLVYIGETASNICVYLSILKEDEVQQIKLGNEGQQLKFFSVQEFMNLPVTKALKFYLENYEQGLKMLIEREELDNVSLLGLKV